MLIKIFYIFLFSLMTTTLVAQKPNCKVVFHLKNTDSTYYSYFSHDTDELFVDTIADAVDSFSVYYPEPTVVTMFIENDTARMFSFYVYPGRLELYIDAANTRQSAFINSPINNDFSENKRKLDSIKNIVYTSEVRKKIKQEGSMSPLRDSVNTIFDKSLEQLDKERYKEGFKKTSSFHTLLYVNFWLKEILLKGKDAPFTKSQLKLLFNKLDKSMKNYPTYKECVKMFKQKVPTRPVVNEPLYQKKN